MPTFERRFYVNSLIEEFNKKNEGTTLVSLVIAEMLNYTKKYNQLIGITKYDIFEAKDNEKKTCYDWAVECELNDFIKYFDTWKE